MPNPVMGSISLIHVLEFSKSDITEYNFFDSEGFYKYIRFGNN